MSADTLSELLRAVRLRGAIFYYVEGIAPWVAEAPAAREIAPAILPGAEHMIEYHVVTQGRCFGALAGETAVTLDEGDIIMFPQGDAHVMSSGPGMRASKVDKAFFFSPRPEQLPYVLTQRGEEAAMRERPAALRHVDESRTTARLDGGGVDRAMVVCGFLGCDARPFNPLLSALPRLLHMPGAAGKSAWIDQFIRMAVDESNAKRPGGEAVLERLS
ncbi:MAG TPA: cupin domain-containing protein, partial [Casimicrobiaceae bacterium]|nr:cupin domain-containing protein [Casimicrobiaceae bacterium]